MIFLGRGINVGEEEPKEQDVYLSDAARRQGVYVTGTTGTGKTTLLKSIVQQDMEDAENPAVIVLDPHGDMIDDLLEVVPDHRLDYTVLFAPGDRKHQHDYPQGLNILSCNRDDDQEKELVSSTVISTLHKLFFYSWGPRMEDLLRNSILTLMHKADSTLLDIWMLLADENYRLEQTMFLTEPFQLRFWALFERYSAHDRAEIAGSSLNKIGRFLGNPIIRNIVGQPKNAFDLEKLMNNGGILLCDLSKGDLGEDNSTLLGAVIVNLILIAALRRRDIPIEERRRVHLIVDEYQSFATETFPTLQSEARKYNIDVIVAHQYRDQLDELNRGSTLNVANFITLRVSGKDGLELATQFDNSPDEPEIRYEPIPKHVATFDGVQVFEDRKDPKTGGVMKYAVGQPRRMYSDVAAETANEMARLPNYDALCRVLEGRKLVEYLIQLEAPHKPSKKDQAARQEKADYIREQSRKRGRPRKTVERLISRKLQNLPPVADQTPTDDIPPARG